MADFSASGNKMKNRFARGLRTQASEFRQIFSSDEKKQEEPVQTVAECPVLDLTVHVGDRLQAKPVRITTDVQKFTIGNASGFDICLDPDFAQAGDVDCRVFFDIPRNAWLFVQPTGNFRVPIKSRSEKYRPGDWSLSSVGSRFEAVAQDVIAIPVSSGDDIQFVHFDIAGVYHFDVCSYEKSQAPTHLSVTESPSANESEDAQEQTEIQPDKVTQHEEIKQTDEEVLA